MTSSSPHLPQSQDYWFIATVGLALVMSILSTWYSFQHHYILLYNDAYAHLRIARAVLDNVNPGLVQLGGAWLPLPHLLMLPLIWNDYLWQTGLAGSIPSMLCYLVTAIYLFLAARYLIRDSRAAFIGTLAFIINPNVLYLQTTPLSEIMCMASIAAACFYTLLWIQEERLKYLLLAAVSTCLATLIRYDGWALYLALLILIALVGWLKHTHRQQIARNVIIFGAIGALGMVAWLLWQKVIYGDPLYFLDGPYSSKAGQAVYFYYHAFYTYHNLWKSCLFYLDASLKTLGPLFFALAIAGAITFLIRRKYTPSMLIMLAWLVPFGFYVASFYTGNVPIFVPDVVPPDSIYHLFNVRYAVHMVAPGALFLAALANQSTKIPWLRYKPIDNSTLIAKLANQSAKIPWFRHSSPGYDILIIAIILQAILTSATGILSLQDGLYGVSCAPQHQITIFLAQHYDKGKILDDVSATNTSFEDAGIDLKNVIYEASGQLWQQALNDPATVADWVVTKSGDTVAQHINVQSPAFLAHFAFIMQDATGLRLYHRSGTAPLPTRSVPSYLLTEHQRCGAGGH